MISTMDAQSLKTLLAEIAALKAENEALAAQRDRVRAEKNAVSDHNRKLAAQVAFLKVFIEKLKRGHQSEKLNPDQLELFGQECELRGARHRHGARAVVRAEFALHASCRGARN